MTKRTLSANGRKSPGIVIKPSNKNQADAQARQRAAQRREQIASLYHSGLTQTEIGEQLGCSQQLVSQDLALLRAQWHSQATTIIGDWVERELAFALVQRNSVLTRWQTTLDSRLMAIVVKWTERISKLLGLDAPDKIEDWTNRDWREYAVANGLNEAEVIAEAEQIIAEAKRGFVVLETGSGT